MPLTRAVLYLAAAALIAMGSLMPACASAPPRAARGTAPNAIRGEAPHLELQLSPRHVTVGQELLVTGILRGYGIANEDFCLTPEWQVIARDRKTGAELTLPVDAAAQCRDHLFQYKFSFIHAGIYGLRLELRTGGSHVRLQDQAQIFVEIDESGEVR